jgi:hypothetical protein
MLVSNVRAAYTPIFAPPPGEVDHKIILDELYGGDFVAEGVNFTNNTIIAERAHDDLPDMGILGVVDGDLSNTADQIWHDGFVSASAEARFAKYGQKFGYKEGYVGGTYKNLFNVSGSGFNVTGEKNIGSLLTGKIWRWQRAGGNGPHSSLTLENADLQDHMVTYRITGLDDGKTTWLLFFEDLTLPDCDENYEPDFNDLVVEIKACDPNQNPVPEPGSALAMAGVGWLVCRRFR